MSFQSTWKLFRRIPQSCQQSSLHNPVSKFSCSSVLNKLHCLPRNSFLPSILGYSLWLTKHLKISAFYREVSLDEWGCFQLHLTEQYLTQAGLSNKENLSHIVGRSEVEWILDWSQRCPQKARVLPISVLLSSVCWPCNHAGSKGGCSSSRYHTQTPQCPEGKRIHLCIS